MADKVVFRKFSDGQVVALFPRIPNTINGYGMMSYMHIGQHGGADPSVVEITKLATPAEYAALAKELRSIGYRLDIAKKMTYDDQQYRQNIAKQTRG